MSKEIDRVRPRPEVMRIPPAHHGAPDYVELEELGFSPDEVLDFSVNSNPYGPSPAVRQVLLDVPLDRYPDREAIALRRALSEHLGNIPLSRIIAGNGTAELLWLIAQAFLRPQDTVLVIGPTFGEYNRVASLMDAGVVTWTASPERSFSVAPEEVERQLRKHRPRLAFVCNPNNPTGTVLPLEVISHWARSNQGTLFVLDEAYRAFAPNNRHFVDPEAENILVLCSMTKDYALAGLRLGYAVGDPEIIEALARVRPAWNVNALAQSAGITALSDQAYLQRTLSDLSQAKHELVARLEELGWQPVPSAVHFFLLPVGNGAVFRRKLLRHRIQVRDCASFGLPGYVRIAARRPEENALLLEALRSRGFSRSFNHE